MKKLNNLFIGAVMLTLGFAGASCDGQSNAADKPRQRPPVEVGVIKLQSQTVTLTTTLPGRTTAFQVAEVRPQITGIIQIRLFTEGAEVKAGEVLYQIDPAPYEAAFGIAKAELARTEASGDIVRLRERRLGELVRAKAVSQQEYDETYAALMQTEAAIQAARASLEAARINLNYTRVKAPISWKKLKRATLALP